LVDANNQILFIQCLNQDKDCVHWAAIGECEKVRRNDLCWETMRLLNEFLLKESWIHDKVRRWSVSPHSRCIKQLNMVPLLGNAPQRAEPATSSISMRAVQTQPPLHHRRSGQSPAT
jgi:hypothetical protein